jgi:hypothetical protein
VSGTVLDNITDFDCLPLSIYIRRLSVQKRSKSLWGVAQDGKDWMDSFIVRLDQLDKASGVDAG